MITFQKKKTGKSYYDQNNHGDLNLLYNHIEINLLFVYITLCVPGCYCEKGNQLFMPLQKQKG